MQNAKGEVTDAKQKSEEASKLYKQARESLENANKKHDEAIKFYNQARESLETAIQKHEEADEWDRQAKEKEKVDEVYKNSGNIETAIRDFAEIFENLKLDSCKSFQITEDLITWTNQKQNHKSQVDFEGYVVRFIIPKSKTMKAHGKI